MASITNVDQIVDFNIPEEFIPKPLEQPVSNKSHKPQDLVSINSSIFNFDTDYYNDSKTVKFPGASQTLSAHGNNYKAEVKELSRQELRVVVIKSITK